MIIGKYPNFALKEKWLGLFFIKYQNVPGECIYAQGGLKFRADEKALNKWFAPILSHVSLNDLIGEAVFWNLLTSTFAIWIFPFFLYIIWIPFALIAVILIYLILEICCSCFYLKSLNYLVFILSNRLLQLTAYIILVSIFLYFGFISKAIILGLWFLFFLIGLENLIFLLPMIPIRKVLFSLPPSDQALRNVALYYSRKLNVNILK